jgi:tripartite-type tricarboxylate transporter receptor subunit TctC
MARHTVSVLTVLVVLIASIPAAGLAQERYPTKPVRVISPITAGSATDLALRAAAQQLQNRMGQPWVVEIRPGGSMIIAAEACATAAPDGYTLGYIGTSASFHPHTFSKLPYDFDRDFKPVTRLFYLVEGVIATASLSVNSVKELRALASAKSASLNYGTLGDGTSPDVFRQWLNRQWQTSVAGIPYKGAPQIITAIIANEVQMTQIGLGAMVGQLKGGKLKVLAVTGSRRSPLLPDVPTLAEVGLEFPVKAWWGIVAPAGTPDAIVSRLNTEFTQVFTEPKFVEYLENQFLEPAVLGSDAFAAFAKSDRESVGVLVKTFNIPRQ